MSTIYYILVWNAGMATVLGLFVAVVSHCKILRHRPALTHALWLLVLFKLAAPPLVLVPLLPRVAQQADEPTADVAGSMNTIGKRPLPVSSATGVPHVLRSASAASRIEAPIKSRRVPWQWACIGASLCGTLILFAISARQLMRLTWLLRQAMSRDERLIGLAREAAYRMQMRAIPNLYVVDASIIPLLLVRWRNCAIVLPRHLVRQMSDEQLTCILCHELAHYVRGDHWSNVFALLVTALFWWHPVAWWARREMRAAQEVCCDSHVLTIGASSRRCYAETLFKVVEFVQSSRFPEPALLCGFGSRKTLLRRFEMIASLQVNHRSSRWTALVIVTGIAVGFCIPGRGQSQTNNTPPLEQPAATAGQATNNVGADRHADEEPPPSVGDRAAGMASSDLDSKDYQLRAEEADRLVAALEAFGHERIYIWSYDRDQGIVSITASPEDHELMRTLIQLLGEKRRPVLKEVEKSEIVVWEQLGLSLDPIDASQLHRFDSSLHGGLIAVYVRPQSPAATAGLLKGDVLVGLGDWETLSIENVQWILDRVRRGDGKPIRILLLRDDKLREAQIRLSPQ